MIERPFVTSVIRNPQSPIQSCSSSIAALGNFDGLHQGHLTIIRRLKEISTEEKTAHLQLISFYPHPKVFFAKKNKSEVAFPASTLASLRQKQRILSAQQVDALTLFHFTKKFSQMTAADFLQHILKDLCKVSTLVVGPDACVGHKREGDVAWLQKHALEYGICVVVEPWALCSDIRPSSSAIRQALAKGDLALSQLLLGRVYAIEGRVVHGDMRGRQLGYPTANMHVPAMTIPMNGVYAGYAQSRYGRQKAVCNVGTRPTFGAETLARKIEVHIIQESESDYQLYGQLLEFEFVERLRDEKQFESVAELKLQIEADISRAKQRLK